MQNKPIITRLRAMTYNIRKTRGLDGRKDAGRILDILNQSGADVIALQEADFRFGQRETAIPRRLIENSSDYQVAPLASNDVSLGWHGNAVLIRKGLTIESVERLALPGLEPRGAVKTKLSNGVSITGVHLGLTRNYRRKQIAEILKNVKEEPGIILGDFNEWSSTKGLKGLYQHFDVHMPGKTFHASRPVASLDRIATSKDFKLNDAGVIETDATRVASDHLPVWIDIDFKPLF